MSTTPQVSRRRALGYAIGTGVVVVAGAAGYLVAENSSVADRDDGYPGRSTPPAGTGSSPAALAAADAIPDGGGLVLTDQRLVLTRSDATVHCFTAVCTHQQCLVTSVSDGAIHCPCHGSAFDANTGAVVQGPASAPLAEIPVTVRDGQVIPS
jgi:Rieske Fe-S protein